MIRGYAGLALVVVAVIWGVTFTVVKDVLEHLPPAAVVAWRFLVAAVLLGICRPRALLSMTSRTVIRGVVLGLLLGGGFLLCTAGLGTTPVVVSAFATGTAVVFAPLVAWVWLKRRPGGRLAVATLLGVLGLGFVTLRGVAVEPGVALILGAALAWAVHLVALERWTAPGQVWASTVVQVATSGLLAAAVLSVGDQPLTVPTDASAVLGLVFLSVLATAAACCLLTWAQSRLDATTAGVLLTLEPVVAALTAVLLGEALSALVVVGALLILVAALLVSVQPAPQPSCPQPG